MCGGSEAGSYVRLIDSCITQLKAQGISRTCNESKDEEDGEEEEEEDHRPVGVSVRNNRLRALIEGKRERERGRERERERHTPVRVSCSGLYRRVSDSTHQRFGVKL